MLKKVVEGNKMSKTRDGIKLTDILSAVEKIEGVTIRSGTKHPYMLNYGQLRPCPVAESTHARDMILPWLKQIDVLKQYNKQTIYQGLKQGDITKYFKN